MRLKYRVKSLDEVDSKYHDLYTEKDGEYVLDVEGVKTQEDIDRLQESLRKERNDHKETKEKYRSLDGLDVEDVIAKLDEYDELKAKADNSGNDDEKVEKLVEARMRSKLAPLERELQQAKAKNGELEGEVNQYKGKEKERTIHDHIRKAAATAKVRDTAIEDALVYGERVFDVDESGRVVTKDGVGVTPGLTPDVWLSEIKNQRPHWWPESKGAGANGGNGSGGGSNPWSKENWNMTEQGRFLTEHGQEKAEQMAQSAGTSLGGRKPEK